MHRRAFLVGAAGALGTAIALRAGAAQPHSSVDSGALLRLDPAGESWVAVDAAQRASTPQRLRLLGPSLRGARPLAGLELDLLYPSLDATEAVQPIWRYRQAEAASTGSRSTSLLLPEPGLRLRFRLTEADQVTRHFEVELAALAEGDYLVRLDGGDCSAALRCGAQGPLPDSAHVFHLQLQAEAVDPEPCLRADLACRAADSAQV